MADDLDQGYMQTRQTMRDWQNRMLFMETTQEGNQVHMGVQVGGKETDGKGVAPTAQPQPEAPVTLAPDATLPPEQPQAQQPNTITVDTPEVAAVKQQFSAHMQEVASGEAGMKALGKGGKALAEAARPGFETAAIALGMDEEAAATVGQAFVEFMGGLPSDDSTDLQAGFETAIAVLPAVGAMYKSGKMVGKAAVEGLTKNRDAIIQEFRKAGDILKSERGSVPLGGGGAKKFEDRFPIGAEVEYHGISLTAGITGKPNITRGIVTGYKKDPVTGDMFAEINVPGKGKDVAGDISNIRLAGGGAGKPPTIPPLLIESSAPPIDGLTNGRGRILLVPFSR